MMYLVLKFNIKMETYNTSQGSQSERSMPVVVQSAKAGTNPLKSNKSSMQMETGNKKIEQLINDINSIFIDAKNPTIRQTMERKLQNYNRINGMVEETTQLLNRMEMDIQKMEGVQMDQTQYMKINDWLEMLSSSNLGMKETIYIVEQLQAMLQGLSSETDIVDNVDQEIIYEEQEIFDD